MAYYTDTHPDAERVQIELLRNMTAEDRLTRAWSLTTLTINLSRRAIAERNPDLSPAELDLKCVALFYGDALSSQLREYLKGRQAINT
jgi:hypothetical protein